MTAIFATPIGGEEIGGRPHWAPQGLRVLVAEDDACNQQVLRLMMERRGYQVHVVDNGRRALSALAETDFDLMLLDMRMPEIDGLHVVKSLRRFERDTPGLSHLPVIAVTALAAKADRVQCMEAGVDEYLSKPFRIGELYAAIDRALRSAPSECRWSLPETTFADPLVF